MTAAVRDPQAGDGVFRGWYVVAGVFVMLLVTAGIGFYGLGVYLRALTDQQGFSVSAVSGATAVFFGVSGIVGIPVASSIARRDPRLLIAVGALACGVALLLLGRVQQVWHIYAVYALFGAGFAASSLVPGTTLVTRWFSRRRAVALSVASTGLSAGGVLITPLVATLVRVHGLPAVAPYLALALVLGVVPATMLLLRPSPEALGLHPDGDRQVEEPGVPARPRVLAGTEARVALGTRFYACVTAGHLLAMLAQVGAIAHLYSLVAEREDGALGATAISVLAISSLVGRLLGGAVASKVSMRAMAVVLMVVQAVSLGLLALVGGPLTLLGLTVLFGLTVGNLLMLHPLLLAERFGSRDYSHIYSRSALVATLGIAGGPFFLGYLHDALGGYGVAFALAGLASIGAAAVLSVSGPTHPAQPDVAPA